MRCKRHSPEQHVTQLYYKDRQALWLAVDEAWMMGEGGTTCERTKIREFRYDGSRQRYLVQSRDPNPQGNPTLLPNGDAVWTDYDGDAPLR